MHGLIFAALRDYSLGRLDETAADRLWATHLYEATQAYEDDEFRARLADLCEATGDSPDDLALGFGRFAGEQTFAGLYPDYYEQNEDTLAFLLGIEERIHTVVRATIHGAQPPKLHVRELGAQGVLVSYTSERRLCRLLEGLVDGVASHYEETLLVEEIQCMHHGDPGCVFTVLREAA